MQEKTRGYWEERSEKFDNAETAKNRAAQLGNNENISHVTVEKNGNEYFVSYSIAKWYLEELRKAGIEL